MKEAAKLLLIIVKEGDMWRDGPLYKAIVQHLHQRGVAGATVQSGIMGFGRHHRVHGKGLFGVSDDRPITIVAADADGRLRSAAAEIRGMMRDGLVLLLDAETVSEGTATHP